MNWSKMLTLINFLTSTQGTKYGWNSKFLNSVPSSRIAHLLKTLKTKHKQK